MTEYLAELLGIDREAARLVEAWLRLAHGTLDGLSPAQIRADYSSWIAEAIRQHRAESQALAASYGLAPGSTASQARTVRSGPLSFRRGRDDSRVPAPPGPDVLPARARRP